MTRLGRDGNLYSAIIQKNDRSEVNESKIAQLIVIVRMSGNGDRSAHEREQAPGLALGPLHSAAWSLGGRAESKCDPFLFSWCEAELSLGIVAATVAISKSIWI